MKKLFALLLVLCLAFAGVIGYVNYKSPADPAPEESPAAEEGQGETQTEESAAGQTVDYAAIYESLDKDQTVLTVGGREISWGEYFAVFYSQAQQVENIFANMASYGLPMSWEDAADESGASYIDKVHESTEEMFLLMEALDRFAGENSVELDDSLIQAELESQILAACGTEGTEADFDELLAGMYMDLELYKRMLRMDLLYQQNYIQVYGENGELFDPAKAMAYLEEGQYMRANHILFATVDLSTGEALDQAAIDEKLAQAQEISRELSSIQGQEERVQRFLELKEELCEDGGKLAYPEGYTFTTGEMVAEFEDGWKSLEDYQVSEPVETDYGYHVIIRLPLDTGAVISYSSGGVPLSAMTISSNAEYTERIAAVIDGVDFSLAPGFEGVDLSAYIK